MQLRSRPSSRSRCLAGCLLVVLGAAPAGAQVLIANDDGFGVPYAASLAVEAFGVLENDTLDGEAAGESGATAELVSDVSHGALALASDGSFTYTPGPGFDGSDSFVYRAVFGASSAEATVTLTACEGGPQIFTCWNEAAFLALAAALGHPSFAEGFEDDAAWGIARYPTTVPHVDSRGIRWRANDFDPSHTGPPPAPPAPPPNEITTGPGPARTGQWAIFDLAHGYAWGTATACDVDIPEPHCLYHDGFTLARIAGSSPLYGAGGYVTGTFGANVAFVLDGDIANPIGGGQLFGGGHQFFGVIDAGPTGWDEVQIRELDGKVGQALFVFADDFTVLATGAVGVPASSPSTRIALGLLLAATAARRLRRGRVAT